MLLGIPEPGIGVSLGVIIGVIFITVIASIWGNKKREAQKADEAKTNPVAEPTARLRTHRNSDEALTSVSQRVKHQTDGCIRINR